MTEKRFGRDVCAQEMSTPSCSSTSRPASAAPPRATAAARPKRPTSAASAPENYFDPNLDFDRLFRSSKRFTQKPLEPAGKGDVSSIYGSKLPGVPIADLDGAFSKVDEQKARNTELKRELLLRQTRYGVSQAEYRKRQEILKYRKELNTMLGGDIAEEVGMDRCGNASREEIFDASKILNEKLAAVFADPSKRNWYSLFLHLDKDRSGIITYRELHKFIRSELRMPASALPNDRLMRVWSALDSDASGHLTAGEFGAFMRLAPYKPPETWKERLHKAKVQQKREGRAQFDKMVNADVAKALAAIQPASDAELEALSIELNKKIAIIFPNPLARQWFRLFKHIDKDDAGRIYYEKFKAFVRDELELSKEKLPDTKFDSLWRKLDGSMQGYVTAARFGPFMKLGSKAATLLAHEVSGGERFATRKAALHRRVVTEYAIAASRENLVITDELDELKREGAALEAALRRTEKAEASLNTLWAAVPKTPDRPKSSHVRMQESAAARAQKVKGGGGYFNAREALLGGTAAAGSASVPALPPPQAATSAAKTRPASSKPRGKGLGTSASAPSLKDVGGGAPRGRGDAASIGPMSTGKGWGACNFDKLWLSGALKPV